MRVLGVYRLMRHKVIDVTVLVSMALFLAHDVWADNSTMIDEHSQHTEVLDFNVWLDDRQIGEHTFEISKQGEAAAVRSKVQMVLKVLFVPVFKYQHEATESWSDNCLQGIESTTQTQGDSFAVSGQGSNELFKVTSSQNESPAVSAAVEGCAATYAYWDRPRLEGATLVNSQTGQLSEATLVFVGQGPLPKAERLGLRYTLTTDEAIIDLWYDDQDKWLALQTVTDGRTLTYLNKTI